MSSARPASGFYKDSNHTYHCSQFENLEWVEHGFTTSRTVAVLSITTLRQIHSDQVINATHLHDRMAEGDALITNLFAQPIGVRTADCVPILMVDTKTRAVAAVHAGWRGTLAEIASKTLLRLGDEFGTEAADVHVAIGPAIGACCYEVGFELAERFGDVFDHSMAVCSPDGRPKLDLVEANRRSLVAASVPEHQIYSSGLCTYCCSGDFFSYRRDPANPGRMISYIGRRE